MNNKGMYLGKFTYRDGGLVRMEPGGPTNDKLPKLACYGDLLLFC